MELFKELGISNNLLKAIEKLGFDEPTKVQNLSIPHIVEGRDVIGESATGSGKTLAFGCGVVSKVEPDKGVQSIILTPTRELAKQVKEAIERFSHFKNLKVMSVYGGVSINPQIQKLQNHEVVVATPGRLLDHLSRGTIDTSNVKLLVLDEADRMLDMGFIDDVEKIIKQCPKDRQTLFFSATISGKIRSLADRYMNNKKEVNATKMVNPEKLTQVYYNVAKNRKLSLLVKLLKEEKRGLVMVFCNTRRATDFVAKTLKKNNLDATAIHGGYSQNKRERTIKSFNDGKAHILTCTDVAARGIHIDDVSHIYNYDLPDNPKDYVHRIGRTARAGEEGKVINILCNHDHDNFQRILDNFRDYEIKEAKTPKLGRIRIASTNNRRRKKGRRRRHR